MRWYSYLICSILVLVGAFCGIQLYKEVKAESYVNGSIDISNKFVSEEFNYASTSVVFYHDLYDDTDTYYFEKELLTLEDFNGQRYNYTLYLNDFILFDTEFNAGSIYSAVTIDFHNEYGQIVHSANMHIAIKFLNSKTTLTLSTISEESATFLERYFEDNGIRLKVDKNI